jgi:hypothetical protein
MPKNNDIIELIDTDFEDVSETIIKGNSALKEITPNTTKIKALAPKTNGKEIGSQPSLNLGIEIEREVNGIGMGVLGDGTPYLNQRGLSGLCGVQNAHIGTISSQWNEEPLKPRIATIKKILEKAGYFANSAHIEIPNKGITHFCYPAEVCLAILEYYAFDAGSNCQPQARDNYRLLAGTQLREMIYSQVGYDPTGKYIDRFKKWHERIELNHQSAPKGFFSVFNEAHTIIYEMIRAGAEIGEKTVVDISIGQHWAKYWDDNRLATQYGARIKYPHKYPDSHPQAKSNPQEAWCYPLSSLGEYREWLQNTYIEGGKFAKYIDGKVKKRELPPSVAQLAIAAVEQTLIEGH